MNNYALSDIISNVVTVVGIAVVLITALIVRTKAVRQRHLWGGVGAICVSYVMTSLNGAFFSLLMRTAGPTTPSRTITLLMQYVWFLPARILMIVGVVVLVRGFAVSDLFSRGNGHTGVPEQNVGAPAYGQAPGAYLAPAPVQGYGAQNFPAPNQAYGQPQMVDPAQTFGRPQTSGQDQDYKWDSWQGTPNSYGQ